MRLLCWSGPLLFSGCAFLPDISHQPRYHNPFPQLSKVAIAPFFNLSTEPTVDGRQFALAYFNELQLVPGYEVVPVGVVEKALEMYNLSLDSPTDARRLAQVLGVDAVVVGAVTDFSPYYPPRCGLQVEWYAANPCLHPIPPGYGLPWGTLEEEQIPASLVFEAEMALAKAQMQTQTPLPGLPTSAAATGPAVPQAQPPQSDLLGPAADPAFAASVQTPPDWPDPRGFVPPLPAAERPPAIPTDEPVLRHTRTINGHDADVTTALENYVFFRDDARFGGWQAYLQRSDEFIRFCCYLHIAEMLTARGGADETRVVWRWPIGR
jgi:hypothetical protein